MGFTIRAIVAGEGVLGISPLPGRYGSYRGDLGKIARWRPGLVISMTTQDEMNASEAGDLPRDLGRVGCAWLHLPVSDYGMPDGATLTGWPDASLKAQQVLAARGRVLVHCKGGCGRSGMAIMRILVDMGVSPQVALARLRAAKGCAVETQEQLRWASGA